MHMLITTADPSMVCPPSHDPSNVARTCIHTRMQSNYHTTQCSFHFPSSHAHTNTYPLSITCTNTSIASCVGERARALYYVSPNTHKRARSAPCPSHWAVAAAGSWPPPPPPSRTAHTRPTRPTSASAPAAQRATACGTQQAKDKAQSALGDAARITTMIRYR